MTVDLPIDKTGANLFFQLIAKRYEHNSTIITTNQPFSKWADVFSDAMLANAILDRLLHHSHVVKVVGPSYRTKDYYELLDAEEQKKRSVKTYIFISEKIDIFMLTFTRNIK